MGRHREERRKKNSSPYWTRNKVEVVIKSGWRKNKVDVVVNSGWTTNSVNIQTRYTKAAIIARQNGKTSYDDNFKVNDPIKILANSYLCAKTLDLHNYYKSLFSQDSQQDALEAIRDMRYLTLDGLYLGTTTRLTKDCGAPLSQIHICSDEIEFRGEGNTYTGQLTDYLRSISPEDGLFDVVFLDFCGNLSKNNMEAVELLFQKRLLDVVGIFAITLSNRNGPYSSSYHHEHSFGGLVRVVEIAKKHGYFIGNTDPVENVSHGMCTYICKFMDTMNALDYSTGLVLDQNNLGSDNWVLRSVPNLHFLANDLSESSKNYTRESNDIIQNIRDFCQEIKDLCQNDGQLEERMDVSNDQNLFVQEENQFEQTKDKHGKVVFKVGDMVTVRLTKLPTFDGYSSCHMDGQIMDIDDSRFLVKLKHIDDTVKVRYDRLGKVRGADVNREWKPGDHVQVFEKDGWWEAEVLSYDPNTKLYRIRWFFDRTLTKVPVSMMRSNEN